LVTRIDITPTVNVSLHKLSVALHERKAHQRLERHAAWIVSPFSVTHLD
jgi:hypothetical protein